MNTNKTIDHVTAETVSVDGYDEPKVTDKNPEEVDNNA